jgi:hypothetical protein
MSDKPTANGTQFKYSYQGIHAMLNMPEMAKKMFDHAAKIAALAESRAPVGTVDEPDVHAGLYKRSFVVSLDPRGGDKKDRPEGIVTNIAEDAFYVEFGNSGSEPYYIMRRAMVDVAP